ncbi:GNAT family N-acetyltransferase [Cryobacterium sp. TMT4-31]|uniref:GNAT family N-acetyltransferase n=1 Tax=Cryobacterium sp. TMT4-31 TaxID=1259259 RepID=UPI001F540110|nr:GNAT family protein [Cryobacterium sp. TMT4-31]
MARGLLSAAFDSLELRRVVASCNADNVASARVLEKVGMRREQHLSEICGSILRGTYLPHGKCTRTGTTCLARSSQHACTQRSGIPCPCLVAARLCGVDRRVRGCVRSHWIGRGRRRSIPRQHNGADPAAYPCVFIACLRDERAVPWPAQGVDRPAGQLRRLLCGVSCTTHLGDRRARVPMVGCARPRGGDSPAVCGPTRIPAAGHGGVLGRR